MTSEGCEGDAGPADTATGDAQQTKAKAKAGAGMAAVSRSSCHSSVSVFMSSLAEAKLPPEKYRGQQKVHDCTVCQKEGSCWGYEKNLSIVKKMFWQPHLKVINCYFLD